MKDSHPPIIDKELWEAVQLELERRWLFRETHELRTLGRYTDVQPFTCKVVCGKCGAVYWRRAWTRNGRKVRVWQCGKRYQKKGEVGCRSGNLYERDLEKAFLMAWNGIVEAGGRIPGHMGIGHRSGGLADKGQSRGDGTH